MELGEKTSECKKNRDLNQVQTVSNRLHQKYFSLQNSSVQKWCQNRSISSGG